MDMNLIDVVVSAKDLEAEQIVSLELRPHRRETLLPPFDAGAHIDVHLPNGMVRQYSLCNEQRNAASYRIAVLLDPSGRGGSAYIHADIQLGDVLRVGKPRNLFPLVPCGETVLFAGGIGITPIIVMAEELHLNGQSFRMHYCARSSERAAFRERIAASPYAPRVKFHFDSDGLQARLDMASAIRSAGEGAHFYVCGPAGFIDAIRRAAAEEGVPDSRVHFELFAGRPAVAESDEAFQVRIASTGEVVAIPPSKSVLDVLAACGVNIPVSCEQGVCGTCVTKVLEGIPDHRDECLTEDEREKECLFTPCCSRAHSPLLVLDL